MALNRRILHIDMDAFFAAVELLRRPELKSRPLVIGGRGDPTQRGVVATASYEARKFGVHSAMPLRTAHKLCPDCVFLAVDYSEYSRVSREIKEILRRFSPIMQDVGIDEAYLDVSALDQATEELARDIKHAIRDETGGLTCSIGVAANKRLAKIASDLNKPDGLTIIGEGDLQTKIWPLPVRKVPGIGPKTEERLKQLRIISVGDLAATSLEQLLEWFGQSYGYFLYDAARGIDDRPLVTQWEPKQRSRERTFQRDISDWQTVAKMIAQLSRDLAEELRDNRLRARTISIKLRFANFETYPRDKTLTAATDSTEIIRKAAFDCLGRIELKRPVRLLGVRVGGFEKAGQASRDL